MPLSFPLAPLFLISSHSALTHIPAIKATGGLDQTISIGGALMIVIIFSLIS